MLWQWHNTASPNHSHLLLVQGKIILPLRKTLWLVLCTCPACCVRQIVACIPICSNPRKREWQKHECNQTKRRLIWQTRKMRSAASCLVLYANGLEESCTHATSCLGSTIWISVNTQPYCNPTKHLIIVSYSCDHGCWVSHFHFCLDQDIQEISFVQEWKASVWFDRELTMCHSNSRGQNCNLKRTMLFLQWFGQENVVQQTISDLDINIKCQTNLHKLRKLAKTRC